MDIEKLIERLKECSTYGFKQEICGEAATALSTLQDENKRLNKIVCSIPTTPDSGRTVSQYDKEMSMCAYLDDLEAENEKLRETVDKYATAARAIALHLKPFCDESLPYDEMIADAARKASDELEQVMRENDALWMYIEIVDREYRRYMDMGYIDRLDELKKVWKHGQEED